MKLVLRILNGAVTAVLAVILVATVALAITARRSQDGMPSVLGYKVLSVLSGSMEPAIKTGDVIIVEPLKPDHEIKEGDVITFRAADAPEMLITHRVVGIVSVNGEPTAYVTKGDNNDAVDLSPVSRSQVVGIQRWRVPYYGYLREFMRKPVGIVSLVIAPGVLLIAMEIRKIVQVVMEEERAKKAEKEPADAQSPS
ncbi:signal peptidase [Symbiobacterium terraclitae]|uniref:Signal peptidase I n=1 Tax=Symbiobacterium terraclitae TaxID=557451 RepID=A0ABS4JNU4_9FIRM|nr:signal peptidase [Symbiobacterium terraclitae]